MRWTLTFMLVAACSGGKGNAGLDSGDASNDECSSTVASSASRFDPSAIHFDLLAYPWGVLLEGISYDGPVLMLHEETERVGPCRLLRYTPTAPCEPECAVGQACVENVCLDHPEAIDVGTLSLAGVTNEVISVEPVFDGSYYWSTEDTVLENRAPVTLEAAGDDEIAFSLGACASEAPVPDSDWDGLMAARRAEEDVTLSWSNVDTDARIYLRMTTGIGTHGGISPVEIECEGPDTGSLTLPGSFLDALFETGWSCGECGYHELYRRRLAETSTKYGALEFRAGSSTSFSGLPNAL